MIALRESPQGDAAVLAAQVAQRLQVARQERSRVPIDVKTVNDRPRIVPRRCPRATGLQRHTHVLRAKELHVFSHLWYRLASMDVSEEQRHFRLFAQDRDWERFHTPKNLAMALAGEVGELLEIFQWLTPEQAGAVMTDERRAEQVRHELADVTLYLIRLADVLDVDLTQAVRDKLRLNADRYPVALSRGNSTKYTELS